MEQFSRLRPLQPEVWDRLARGLYYVSASFEDPGGYGRLADLLEEVERKNGVGRNRVFYLATPPTAYAPIVARLGAAGLVSEAWNGPPAGGAAPGGGGWSRIIIEKPFGRDLATARGLNAQIHRVFREAQVYRIDH
ncbi:MAG: glucose-6-phosphate dehydrogenase, partial [candidate division NC10 bacterium]|nr:glucose-6-phosphate dehydrogenase [candidate division NC10 bacterium]